MCFSFRIYDCGSWRELEDRLEGVSLFVVPGHVHQSLSVLLELEEHVSLDLVSRMLPS